MSHELDFSINFNSNAGACICRLSACVVQGRIDKARNLEFWKTWSLRVAETSGERTLHGSNISALDVVFVLSNLLLKLVQRNQFILYTISSCGSLEEVANL